MVSRPIKSPRSVSSRRRSASPSPTGRPGSYSRPHATNCNGRHRIRSHLHLRLQQFESRRRCLPHRRALRRHLESPQPTAASPTTRSAPRPPRPPSPPAAAAPPARVNMTASGAGVTSNALPVLGPSRCDHHPALACFPDRRPKLSRLLLAKPDFAAERDRLCQRFSTTPFCAPAGTTGVPTGVPDCSVNLGHFTYTPVNTAIVTIDQNGVATAHQPGSSPITAAISNVSSTAGSFATCPPASIQLQIPSTISSNPTVGSVTPGTAVPLTTTIYDTNHKPDHRIGAQTTPRPIPWRSP